MYIFINPKMEVLNLYQNLEELEEMQLLLVVALRLEEKEWMEI